jgi:hypothetical protein
MQTTAHPSPAMSSPMLGLLGQFKTFGVAGPAYEIVAGVRALPDDWLMQVRVLESGEELELPVSQIAQDPKAE